MGTLSKSNSLKPCYICDNVKYCIRLEDENNFMYICKNCLNEALELMKE